MLHRIVAVVLVLFGVVCSANSASAELVTYSFTGVITKVAGGPPGSIPLSGVSPAVDIHQGTSTFTGLLQFEDNAPSYIPPDPNAPHQLPDGGSWVFPVVRIPEPGVRRSLAFGLSFAQLGIVVDDSLHVGFSYQNGIDPGFFGTSASAGVVDRDPLADAPNPRYDGFFIRTGDRSFVLPKNYVQLDLGGDTSLFDNDPFTSASGIDDYIPLLYSRSLLASTLYTAPDGEVFQLSLGGAITSFERIYPQDPIIFSLQAVPEPTSWTLLVCGSLALLAVARRKFG